MEHYINGMFSGTIASIISHPCFNLKNAMQNGELISKQNFTRKWLYSGLTPAAVGFGLEKMFVFGTYKTLKEKGFSNVNSGLLSGCAASLITTVSEQIAIDKTKNIINYKFKHLYSGFIPTMMRDSIGFMIYFGIYEYLTNKYNKNKDFNKTAIISTITISISWFFISPIDRIKTSIQSKNFKDYDYKKSFNGFSFAMLRAIPFHVTSFCVMEYLSKQ